MLKKDTVEIREKMLGSKGIFARKDLRKGEYIFRNWNDNTRLLMVGEIKNLFLADRLFFEKYSSEFTENMFVGPHESQDISAMPEYFINHSCDPNTWLVDDEHVVARHDIRKGEEITIDYATIVLHEFESARITHCFCSAALCRGSVSGTDWWLLKEVYKGHFVSFIQRKIDALEQNVNRKEQPYLSIPPPFVPHP